MAVGIAVVQTVGMTREQVQLETEAKRHRKSLHAEEENRSW